MVYAAYLPDWRCGKDYNKNYSRYAAINLHLNCASRVNQRSITVDFEGGYVRGDLINGVVEYMYGHKKKMFKFKVD